MYVRLVLISLVALTATLAAIGCAPLTPAPSAAPPLGSAPATLPATNVPAPPRGTVTDPTASPSVDGKPAATRPAVPAADWTMYHRDPAHTGYVQDTPDPTRLSVVWQQALDGAVYAQPLVIGGHVLVATEGNSLYSLAAASGAIEWHANIGAPVPRAQLPCGNIDPLGITGTPVYDSATGLVFAVAEVTGPAHLLVGVDVRSGEVRVRRGVDVPGMDPAAHQQRAALALLNGTILVAFGGLFGDCGQYQGTVVGSRTDGRGALTVFRVPTARMGGIWAPAGPALDAAGQLYVSVGNGEATSGDWDRTDSVLRLSPDLKLEDGFAPSQWPADNQSDADLGSLAPVLLPNGLVFIAGKAGIGYLLQAGALGGVGGQLMEQPVCHAYGGAAVAGSNAFVPCNEGVQQVKVDTRPGFTLGWRADGVTGSPVLGGRTVYSLDRSGTLHALDIETGTDRATVSVGETSRFASPTLWGKRIFVGTLGGITAVDGS